MEVGLDVRLVLFQAHLSVQLNAMIIKRVLYNYCLIKQTMSYVASEAAERLQII